MASPLAPMLLASLARLAAFDADVGARADAVSTTVDASRAPAETRTALSAVPSAAAILDAWRLRMTARYAPRLWTSDVGTGRSPLLSHELEGRVETRHERPWRVGASARAVRGEADLLLDPGRAAAATGSGQVSTTGVISYEELQAGLAAQVPLGLRTSISAGAGWQSSRATGSDAGLLPSQRGASADASVVHLATERDSVAVAATGTRTLTGRSLAAPARSGAVTATLTWRRRLAPATEGWLGAGAAWLYAGAPVAGRERVEPVGELGIIRRGEGTAATVTATLRATTFVDRFTGEVSPALDGRLAAAWPWTERLSVSTSAWAGARTDGDTRVAGADARATWFLRRTWSLEAGVLGRAQEERRSDRPTFVEAALFASVVFRRERILGRAEEAAPR